MLETKLCIVGWLLFQSHPHSTEITFIIATRSFFPSVDLEHPPPSLWEINPFYTVQYEIVYLLVIRLDMSQHYHKAYMDFTQEGLCHQPSPRHPVIAASVRDCSFFHCLIHSYLLYPMGLPVIKEIFSVYQLSSSTNFHKYKN